MTRSITEFFPAPDGPQTMNATPPPTPRRRLLITSLDILYLLLERIDGKLHVNHEAVDRQIA